MSKSGKNKPSGEYPIGYCKPPVVTQFKPGTSGNSKRSQIEPHNDLSTIDIVLEEKRTVIVRGKKRRMCNEALMIRQQNDKAVGGDLKSTIFLLDRRDKSRASRMAQPEGHYDLTLLTNDELDTVDKILSKAAVKGPRKLPPGTNI